MHILGIETSCDETAAAVVRDGREVLSSVIHTQVALHRPYGGVVPEIASRSHVTVLPGILKQALAESSLGWKDIDAIAVTYGPGLSTSLLVGVSAAKALAIRLDKPLIGINHIEGHLYSIFLGPNAPRIEDVCPFISLVVSGGHTSLFRVRALGQYTLIGQTIDDAAGEAFDKGAKLMNLGFPGGPAIDKASRGGNPDAGRFPRGRQRSDRFIPGNLDPELCFSFSGLKTALLYHLRDNPLPKTADGVIPPQTASVAASYQEAIVDSLVETCDRALKDEKHISMGGGVSLNRRLREKLGALAMRRGVTFHAAEPKYCADNAAMIAGLAGAGCGIRGPAAMSLDIHPTLPLGLPDAAP